MFRVVGRAFQKVSSVQTRVYAPAFSTLRQSPAAFAFMQMRWMATKAVKLPSMGESITSGTVQSWLKKEGDYVKADEVVVVIESDKLSQEIRSPEAGMISKLLAATGKEVAIGGDLFEVDTSKAPPAGQAEAKPQPKAEAPKSAAPVEAKPAAAAAPEPARPEPARAESKPARPAEEPRKAPATKPVVTVPSSERVETRERMSKMRQRIATRLKDAQNTAAMLTTFQECDMSRAIEMRNAYKDEFAKKHNVKLGFMSFFVKAAAHALKEYPIANAVIDGDEIVYRNYMDIAVAVATPTGLIVPVIRNCQSLSFADVEKTIGYYGEMGKKGQIPLEDMYGGTFTISNGGVYGSMMGTPIINPPQSSILGIHAIETRAVVRDDKIVARPMMYLALTYDHRLLDGKNAVTFLRKIKLCVEDPSRLLLEL